MTKKEVNTTGFLILAFGVLFFPIWLLLLGWPIAYLAADDDPPNK